MSGDVNICEVCFRTDAFTLGKIDHDKAWHESVNWFAKATKLERREWMSENPSAVELGKL
jgi:hypothetical protein